MHENQETFVGLRKTWIHTYFHQIPVEIFTSSYTYTVGGRNGYIHMESWQYPSNAFTMHTYNRTHSDTKVVLCYTYTHRRKPVDDAYSYLYIQVHSIIHLYSSKYSRGATYCRRQTYHTPSLSVLNVSTKLVHVVLVRLKF